MKDLDAGLEDVRPWYVVDQPVSPSDIEGLLNWAGEERFGRIPPQRSVDLRLERRRDEMYSATQHLLEARTANQEAVTAAMWSRYGK